MATKNMLQYGTDRVAPEKLEIPTDLLCHLFSGIITGDNKMKQIGLTQSKTALVDDEDYEIINKYNWYAHKIDTMYYAERWICIPPYKVSMHRFLMNVKGGQKIDHFNGNGLDNQKSNLRFATSKENSRNRKKRVNTTSKYIGVSWSKFLGKWYACIKPNGKTINLGYYHNDYYAARSYDDAARFWYGRFARTNFAIGKDGVP